MYAAQRAVFANNYEVISERALSEVCRMGPLTRGEQGRAPIDMSSDEYREFLLGSGGNFRERGR